MDLIVLGAGAAGVFAALSTKRSASVLVLEKGSHPLAKVRISGGGRCNVTNSCFDPTLLIQNYPRGSKELLGPFHRFGPKETVEWFVARGVHLKTEPDGRIFPASNTSLTIVDCLLNEMRSSGIPIQYQAHIEALHKTKSGFSIELPNQTLHTKDLLLATGSSPQGHLFAQQLGHTIEPPLPSLFTFHTPHSPFLSLSGLTLKEVSLSIEHTPFKERGPLLFTHFGLSGPSVLKLSAWAARALAQKNYRFSLKLNTLPHLSFEAIFAILQKARASHPTKTLAPLRLFPLPAKLWRHFTSPLQKPLASISNKELHALATALQQTSIAVEGKSPHKEEFVTCGGVKLSEVNFQTMQSRVCPGLYFAGEILDIDALTGGFNFQSAWTTGHIAGIEAT